MKKQPVFYTIQIDNECFDLPKDMPIPSVGSKVFVESKVGVVSGINYYVTKGELFQISIFTTGLYEQT